MTTASTARNKHLTFKANMGVGRHGWLRLTPAYSVHLVRDRLRSMEPGSLILDPFSGTGTTPLAAAELGHVGQGVDVNPFLRWLGTTKFRNYTDDDLSAARESVRSVIDASARRGDDDQLWTPNLFKIEKWWSKSNLALLRNLRHEIDELGAGPAKDLLELALCRLLIVRSAAAFNHQSMGLSEVDGSAFNEFEFGQGLRVFRDTAEEIFESAAIDLEGSASVSLGDSRVLDESLPVADAVVTSPPYVNRMSYIRELRPYMYWMRYLDQAIDASELDWKAIGGTWGSATSKLNTWRATETGTPVDSEMNRIRGLIAADGAKNGPLLANYVGKYFDDMWQHFQSMSKRVRAGGTVSYIIGNSTFYGHIVPAEAWYASMLEQSGFENVVVETIRKRNSNKHLWEYDVSATKS